MIKKFVSFLAIKYCDVESARKNPRDNFPVHSDARDSTCFECFLPAYDFYSLRALPIAVIDNDRQG